MDTNEIFTDQVVVDREGTVWVYQLETKSWSYVVMAEDGGNRTSLSWDSRKELPADYSPYQVLEFAAANAIRQATGMPGRLRYGIS